MDIAKIFEERFQLEKEYLGIDKAVHSIEPLVSVCVAAYQHVNYIEECIEGILMQQTTFPMEIIIGEDGSSDGTREKCIAYAEEHPDKIRLYLRNRESSQLFDEEGTYITRFNGKWNRRAARGRYIAMCEGDDYWTDPLKLQKQVDFLDSHKEYNLVCTGVKRFNEMTKEIDYPNKLENYTFDYKDLIIRNHCHTCTVLIRNKNLKFSNWELGMGSDSQLWLRTLGSDQLGMYLNSITAVYRKHEGGVSVIEQNKRTSFEDEIRACKRKILKAKFWNGHFGHQANQSVKIVRVKMYKRMFKYSLEYKKYFLSLKYACLYFGSKLF